MSGANNTTCPERDTYAIDFILNSYGVTPLDDKKNKFMAKYMAKYVDKAMHIADDMIEKGKKEAAEQDKDKSKLNWTTEYNSIIVFTGDRGSGKSTVMRTFIKKIKKIQNDKAGGKNEGEKDESVHVLPVIDPTLFAGDERLVGAIVSHIFNRVKEATENHKKHFEPKKTREVYESCDDVHAALRVVYTGVKEAVKNETDSLESLDKLTSSTLLQSKLRGLFKAFAKWGGHKTLIIPIDDVDMKVSGNYDMLEEIRSYLFSPHVLVVMAVKFEQLTDSIEQYFTKQLKGLPSASNALDAQPAEMASKYLLKLIPASRRVALHDLRPETLPYYKVRLIDQGSGDDEKTEPKRIVDMFLELVFEKTGIVLVKTLDDSHGLIPANMRALHHMFSMLHALKPVLSRNRRFKECGEGCTEKEQCDAIRDKNRDHYCLINLEQNLNRIEEWVLDSACSNSVPRGLARIASTFAVHSTEGLHAYLVKELDNYSAKSSIQSIVDGKITQKGLFSEDPVIKTMLAPDALPENISIGDALYVLNTLERLNQNEGIRHFVAIMKMLYSIRMTRATYLHWAKKTREDEYKPLHSLLNGLVYNQNLRLTYDVYERGINVEVDCSKIAEKIMPGAEDLDKKEKVVAWRLWFFVGVGRIRGRDIHTIRRARASDRQPVQYNMTQLRNLNEGDPLFVQFNYLAIINNLLTAKHERNEFIERVKYVFPSKKNQELLSENFFVKDIDKNECWSRYNMFKLFSLSCIDVLDALIMRMNRMADIRITNQEDITLRKADELIWGAGDFNDALGNALEDTYKRTCMGNNEEIQKYNLILKNGPFSTITNDNTNILIDVWGT